MITLFINCAIALCGASLLSILITLAWIVVDMIEGGIYRLHLIWMVPLAAILSATIITILGKLI